MDQQDSIKMTKLRTNEEMMKVWIINQQGVELVLNMAELLSKNNKAFVWCIRVLDLNTMYFFFFYFYGRVILRTPFGTGCFGRKKKKKKPSSCVLWNRWLLKCKMESVNYLLEETALLKKREKLPRLFHQIFKIFHQMSTFPYIIPSSEAISF